MRFFHARTRSCQLCVFQPYYDMPFQPVTTLAGRDAQAASLAAQSYAGEFAM